MFDTFGDVFMGFVSVVAVAYIATEITKNNQKLKDMIYILEDEDAKLTAELEELVHLGQISPYTGAAAV